MSAWSRISRLHLKKQINNKTKHHHHKPKAKQMQILYAWNPTSLLSPPSSKQPLFSKSCWLLLLPQFFFLLWKCNNHNALDLYAKRNERPSAILCKIYENHHCIGKKDLMLNIASIYELKASAYIEENKKGFMVSVEPAWKWIISNF